MSTQAVSVKVVVRVRPQNKIETSRGGEPCVSISDDGTEVDVEDGYNSQKWSFDRVFKPTSRQEDVFAFVGLPVVEAVFKGYNGTIFAYGQTSSGKTHTMTGPDGSLDDPSSAGVIPRCVDAIFDGCAEAPENLEFTVQVQFMEIYLERVKDLLDTRKNNLPIREDIASGRGIYVEGITEEYVTSPEELTELMKTAAANRAVASTGMNAGSSRSHSVTIIRIHQKDTTTGSTKSGKLCLVDLAGSEMISKTGAKGQTLEEAKMINKSLSALGNVINALTEKRTGGHIPYRDSKLTRLLQESLGGNACTVLVVCCSPSSYNVVETISTLRFGNRAKRIENKAKVNQQRSVEELTALLRRAERAIDMQQKYIKKLEGKLAGGVVEAPKEQATAPPAEAPVDDTSTTDNVDDNDNDDVNGGGESEEGKETAETPKESSSGGGEAVEEGRQRAPSADMGAVGTVQLEVRIQELENELKEVKRDLDEERELGGERLRVLQIEMDQVKEEGAGAQKAMVALREECEQAKARVDMEVKLKDSLAEQVDEVRGRVSTLEQEKSKLEFDLEQQRVTVDRLSTQNNNLTEELDNMMLQKQSREEVEQVMQQAAPNTPKGATTPGGSDLREENARLNATVKELSARVAQAMAAGVTGGEINGVKSGMIAMLSSPRGAAASDKDDGSSDSTTNLQDQKDANLAVWAALGPEAQLSEMTKMHQELEKIKAQHDEVMQKKTEEIESLEASDTALVRREIVDQNKKLQIDVHNLVKDLKNRCQKVIQLELALDKERDVRKMLESRLQTSGGGKVGRNAQAQNAAQAKQMKALQKRLEQLVMVHRQLLRKYAQLELEKSEARKLMKLRDDRIAQLDATCRAMSENMMSQSMRHENEVRKLRESEAAARRQLHEIKLGGDESHSGAALGGDQSGLSHSPPRHERKKVHGNVAIRGGVRRGSHDNKAMNDVRGSVSTSKQLIGGGGRASSTTAYTPKSRPSPSNSLGSSGKKKSLFGRLSFFS